MNTDLAEWAVDAENVFGRRDAQLLLAAVDLAYRIVRWIR